MEAITWIKEGPRYFVITEGDYLASVQHYGMSLYSTVRLWGGETIGGSGPGGQSCVPADVDAQMAATRDQIERVIEAHRLR